MFSFANTFSSQFLGIFGGVTTTAAPDLGSLIQQEAQVVPQVAAIQNQRVPKVVHFYSLSNNLVLLIIEVNERAKLYLLKK